MNKLNQYYFALFSLFVSTLLGQNNFYSIYEWKKGDNLFKEIIKQSQIAPSNMEQADIPEKLESIKLYKLGNDEEKDDFIIFIYKDKSRNPTIIYLERIGKQSRQNIRLSRFLHNRLDSEKENRVNHYRTIESDSVSKEILQLDYNITNEQIFNSSPNVSSIKEIMDRNKYLIVDVNSTDKYFEELKSVNDEILPENKFALINLDDGTKQPLIPTNLKPNRFYYTSEDSLIEDQLSIFDFESRKSQTKKIFKEKQVAIPPDLSTHVPIEKGEKLENLDFSRVKKRNITPDSMMIVVDAKSRKKLDNFYKLGNPQAVVVAKDSTSRPFKFNSEINLLVDEKYKDYEFIMEDKEIEEGTEPAPPPLILRTEYWIAGITIIISMLFMV